MQGTGLRVQDVVGKLLYLRSNFSMEASNVTVVHML